ncbi:hypothetical protein [Paracoccus sp. S1E-3]|uniref:YybH family protein n=1 Tax=Paracoccus sp. S1E-3 TaxID=2756130 RepID=UPI001C68BFA8|nr:hypothetical protein [Paracoccus sp. S1E-3]
MSLYKPAGILVPDEREECYERTDEIAGLMRRLLAVPGTMISRNNFCILHGDLALLRADWTLVGDDGATVAEGSSTVVIRKQNDGRWLYVIDHASGARLPRSADNRTT